MKRILILTALVALPAAAEACGSGPARRAVSRTVERVRFRPAVFAAPVAVAMPAPKAVPQNPPPKVMPKTADAGLEGRVTKLEKAATDAGRALLFRGEGTAMPSPKAAPPVVYYRPARVFAPLQSSCPNGRCPNR